MKQYKTNLYLIDIIHTKAQLYGAYEKSKNLDIGSIV